jgi:hypothetical protein
MWQEVGESCIMRSFITFTLRHVQLDGNVKEDKTERACRMHGEKRNANRILVKKPEEERLLGRPKFRLVDNIKMNFRGTGWGSIDWIDLF